jgi:hypothetical protein
MSFVCKYLIIAVMLIEGNSSADELKLPNISQDPRARFVPPPQLAKQGLAGGRLDNKDYAFFFARGAQLQYIQRLAPFQSTLNSMPATRRKKRVSH